MIIKLLTWQKWLIFWLLALSIAWGLNYQNRHLTIAQYKITDQRWPAELNNWRIVQLSDLHNQATSGPGNRQILMTVKNLKPDLIVLTGDTFDSRQTNIPSNLALISQLKTIAPVYLIFGNHDFYNDDYIDLIKQIQKTGAIVLRDQTASINLSGQIITLVGLDDPSVLGGPLPRQAIQQIIRQKLTNLINQDEEKLNQPIIVLAHRPELWPEYLALKPIAILSGHTHGGQIRFPLAGALYVPNQKLWPDYDQGNFIIEDSRLIISRGLGNSSLGQRLNAYPEIVSLDFNHQ
ncbi:hypothetical protein EOM71_02310 [Candidatus Falkowbacteria bacterium]|jgi:hypothetical protein|nr:hypothetical protein [Candidatus Falkowbacteria bacterium]